MTDCDNCKQKARRTLMLGSKCWALCDNCTKMKLDELEIKRDKK